MISTFSSLLPFLAFAFVASITPGPTNILVLSNSARYGFKAALPIVFGACTGAALLVLAVGGGLGHVLSAHPHLQTAMQWAGVAWLSYLAWQIFWAPVNAHEPSSRPPQSQRLGFKGAASLQLINPKSWMMALAVISVFAAQGQEKWMHVMILSLAFFLVSLPCLSTWAVLGARSRVLLKAPNAQRILNYNMGLLLLVSVWLPQLSLYKSTP
ncbi:LysE family translocator [Pseudomonas sp. 10S4]|uniref:LysE family translocator n=1 Tax=Pseudomonas sp. 10S4 TaxID=3048583 RepID=UPI002B235888|nr:MULTISPECIES: LysE family translocator [unclassified Pseudomonas]MEB0228683.1 LysE family translocator [Pseudomonas sp. 5S1]MEB0298293.1 LysE family translocator [Pseudomonas sp. 10S4]